MSTPNTRPLAETQRMEAGPAMDAPLSDRIRAMYEAEYPTRPDWDRAYQGTFPPPAQRMEAGPELDAAVAEHVMGRVVDPPRFPNDRTRILRDDAGCVDGLVPPFSTDIAAAWKVVEALTNHPGYEFWFTLEQMYEQWIASFVFGDPGAKADTAPLAICRAALLVPSATRDAAREGEP